MRLLAKSKGITGLLTSGGLLTRPQLTNLMASIGFRFPSAYMHNRPVIYTFGFSYFSWTCERDLRRHRVTGREKRPPGFESGVGRIARRHGPGREFRFRYKPSFFH